MLKTDSAYLRKSVISRRGPASKDRGRDRLFSLLFAGAVIFQHLELFRFAGFAVTGGLIFGLPMILLATSFRIRGIFAALVLGLAAYSLIVAFINPDITKATDFFGSFSLLMLGSVIISCAVSGFDFSMIMRLRPVMLLVLIVVVGYSFLQVALGALGFDILFNPWGDSQYQYQYNPALEFVVIPRAQGFYLEPSYLAFVICTLAVCLLVLKYRVGWSISTAILGLVVSQSASGLLIACLVLVVYATRAKLIAVLGLILLSLATIFLLGDYLIGRLSSIADPGSSGNYRLLAPLEMLSDILIRYPMGLPLGSIYDVVPTYGLVMNSVDRAISLDNGVYVIIYYWGWLGLVALAVAVFAILKKIFLSQRGQYLSFVGVWLFASLFFSGGILAPEFCIMSAIVIATAVAVQREAMARAPKKVTSSVASHGRWSSRQ